MWERETQHWLPQRIVAILDGRTRRPPGRRTRRSAECSSSTTTSSTRTPSGSASAAPGRSCCDESHYVKNPRSRRTQAAIALAGKLEPDALRLALTGTPILNRPEELIAQLRVLGRLRDFGSGARLARRFRAAGSDDRLHWNLRAHCYVRRTKQQVLPQLPAKRHDTVPVSLVNEHEYRLAETRRGRVAPDAPARSQLDRREGRGGAARGAARAAQQPAPARRHGQAPGRARLDRGLPRLGRAARGVRGARGDPARGARALPGRRSTSSAATPAASARRPWTRSRRRTARS